MTDEDRPEFSKLMFMMASGYQNAVMNDLRIELYFAALSDLDIHTLHQAVTRAVNTCRFCPTIAELRETVEGSAGDRAEIAWQAWKQAARTVGAYGSLVVDDPSLADTIVAVFGSWIEACLIELSEEMWAAKRKEFERVYRIMAQRQPTGQRYFVGQFELHNKLRAEWDTGPTDRHLGLNGELYHGDRPKQLN